MSCSDRWRMRLFLSFTVLRIWWMKDTLFQLFKTIGICVGQNLLGWLALAIALAGVGKGLLGGLPARAAGDLGLLAAPHRASRATLKRGSAALAAPQAAAGGRTGTQ
eukprot:TRINITY_DN4853_c1_g1_i1.p2 TRINITY_DN4853_c1_g1~~TRINITY_DN4853_c1_g1_i1.p2  ORF type:complete len:107 (-),score=7.62 TRINITY_DN4853_c1_g1_i1:19-339(-)